MTDLQVAASHLAGDLSECLPAGGHARVAVCDLLTEGKATYLGQRLADYLADHLHEEIGQNVLDRRDLELQLDEHEFQWSDFAFDRNIVAFGQKTPATVIITGTIDDYPEKFDIRCRAIELRTARILCTSGWRMDRTDTNETHLHRPPIKHLKKPTSAPPIDRQLRTAASRLGGNLITAIRRNRLNGLKVALGILKGPNMPDESLYGKALMSFLQAELQEKGRSVELRLLARRGLKSALDMQRIEHTPFFDENSRTDLDKAEGAHAVLYGHLERVGRACQATIELTDLETKAILHTDSLRIPYGSGQDQLMRPAKSD